MMDRPIAEIEAYLDGEATAEQLAALERWIQSDGANAGAFLSLVQVHHQLAGRASQQGMHDAMRRMRSSEAWLSADEDGAVEALAELARLHDEGLRQPLRLEAHHKGQAHAQGTDASRRLKLKARLVIAGGLAAAVAFAGLIYMALSLFSAPGADVVERDPGKAARVVATLTGVRDARWQAESGEAVVLAVGEGLSIGTRLVLAEGLAELTTNRGAVATLEAPCTIELLDDDNALRLHAGKVFGRVESEGAKGFFVRTAHLDVTDLGTAFGVAIDGAGNTLAEVFAGSVHVKPSPESAASDESYLLIKGDALAVDAVGAETARESFAADTFAVLSEAGDLETIEAQLTADDGVAGLQGRVRLITADGFDPNKQHYPIPNAQDALLYMELQGYRLGSDLALTIDKPGSYSAFAYEEGAAYGVVPAGTVIRSYVLRFKPVTRAVVRNNVREFDPFIAMGEVTFDGRVLGVVTNEEQWARGWRSVAEDGGSILHHGPGGMLEDQHPSKPGGDLLRISGDRHTISFEFEVTSGADMVRIIVAEPGAGGGL